MPPRKSKRLSKAQKELEAHEELEEIEIETHKSDNELENYNVSLQYPTEYFEFNEVDLRVDEKQKLEESSEPDTIPSSNETEEFTQKTLSRKIRLLIRKAHIICEIKSAQFFIKYQMKNQNLISFILSGLPPHILRIFDPIMISEGKTLKNSIAMLVTWWKNNIGSRIIPKNTQKLRLNPHNKLLELRSAFFSRSVYEDDSVKLFSIVCHGLGIKIRLVHSLDLISASTASSNEKITTPTKFQYTPRHWIEIYSSLDERWIAVDCIQGFVDEKNRLENKSKPNCFVIAIDYDGIVFDLTEKYSSDYLGRSFKLRKDEDKWLKELTIKLNSKFPSKQIMDREQIILTTLQRNSIEIPKTLSAIKNHPTLMLASQLRKYEVFYPVTEPVGFFKDESVFLRENVKKVRSKDAWLSQCARIVKSDEKPVKLVNLPRKAGAPESEPTGVQPLYGEWQTEAYVPPEVIDGKVPRNDHGNVDLFQPSMLPKGCVHVTLPGAWKVARHIGIDYADACIGFSFHGGRALPAIHGIVITDANFQIFQSEYENKLIESLRSDAADLEKQISQKWVKIIKNALIARRLKNDSSMSLSESLISDNNINVGQEKSPDQIAEPTISTFNSSKTSISNESEIEEFDAI